MTDVIECRYYGRDFTAHELALLRALIAADPQPTRAALSREFCRRIGWRKPDGGLKDMMARVTFLAMHRDGVIALPPPKGRRGERTQALDGGRGAIRSHQVMFGGWCPPKSLQSALRGACLLVTTKSPETVLNVAQTFPRFHLLQRPFVGVFEAR